MHKSITKQDISNLWVVLTKAYGHKFINSFGETDNGVWYEALKDLSPAELAYGLKRVLTSFSESELATKQAWPPNVKEFRMHCELKLRDYGIPGSSKAFDEVENHFNYNIRNWSHPLLAEISQQLDPSLFHLPRHAAYQRFKAMYDYMAKKHVLKQVIDSRTMKLLSH
jgi:hypothetical protein